MKRGCSSGDTSPRPQKEAHKAPQPTQQRQQPSQPQPQAQEQGPSSILVLFLFSYWLFFLEKKLAKMRKKPASQPINQPAHAQCFAAAARQRTGLSTQSTW